MAADMHIHVLKGVTEDDLARYQSTTLGTKYFNLQNEPSRSEWDDLYERFNSTPNIWVGSVSWLKAALTEDAAMYVPDPVSVVHELIGEDLPGVTDGLIESINAAMRMSNATDYAICAADDIVAFLQAHRGERIFTISW